MPSIAGDLVVLLRDEFGLHRAVETGTYLGQGAQRLASVFAEVVTIELSRELHAKASERLAQMPNVRAMQGHSVSLLGDLARVGSPTLWFLDGHWSGGPTAGQDDECPVLQEIALLTDGHSDDVIVVDDARLFSAPPPPPHDPTQWPSLAEVTEGLLNARPGHRVRVIDDQVVAVPARGESVLLRYQQMLR